MIIGRYAFIAMKRLKLRCIIHGARSQSHSLPLKTKRESQLNNFSMQIQPASAKSGRSPPAGVIRWGPPIVCNPSSCPKLAHFPYPPRGAVLTAVFPRGAVEIGVVSDVKPSEICLRRPASGDVRHKPISHDEGTIPG